MAGVDGEEAPSCASEPMDDSVPEETLEAAEESEYDELDLLPVSYTHLDVYKRQGFHEGRIYQWGH